MNALDAAEELLRLGRPREAAALAIECLRVAQDDLPWLLVLCQAQLALQDPDALATARQCIELAPEEAAAHEVMARVHCARGNPRSARQCLEAALELVPASASLRIQLSNLLRDTESRRRALALADEAIALDPRIAEAHAARARALLELGYPETAAASVREALAMEPDDAELQQLQGRIELLRLDVDAAVRSYREALRLDPHDAEARTGLLQALRARSGVYRGLLGFRYAIESIARRHAVLSILVMAALVFGGLAGFGRQGIGIAPTLLFLVFLLPEQLANLTLMMRFPDRHLLDRCERACAVLVPTAASAAAAAALTGHLPIATNLTIAAGLLGLVPHHHADVLAFWHHSDRRQRLLVLLPPAVLFAVLLFDCLRQLLAD